jgi:Undecaprenyl-phosphate glucose phosphotransferase
MTLLKSYSEPVYRHGADAVSIGYTGYEPGIDEQGKYEPEKYEPGLAPPPFPFLNKGSSTPSRLGLTYWGQWVFAMCVALGVLALATKMKTDQIAIQYRVLAVMTVFCSLPIYAMLRVFDWRAGLKRVMVRITAAWLILFSLLALVAFVTKTGEMFSREVLIEWFFAGLCVQLLAFMPLHSYSRAYHKRQQGRKRSLILGAGELAQLVAEKVVKELREPLIGLVHHSDITPEDDKGGDSRQSFYPVIGNAAHLRALIRLHLIRKIYIALPASDMADIESIYFDLLDENVDVVWLPDVASMMLLNNSVTEVGGLPAINLNESPLTSNPSAAMVKAVMDRTLALLAIICLSPLLAATAIAVKLSSPGPIIFKQPRHGWDGKIFDVWKFRSMREHDDPVVIQATKDDPRVTSVGRFIRKTSIDELPQFFNVLLGDMSLVGPRPHAVAHNDYYANKIQAYMARHRVKPGITGLAQISGCRGETETVDKMEARVKYDLEYINQWSLWMDVKLLLKTPLSLLSKDAY